jgi:hypothetical protein
MADELDAYLTAIRSQLPPGLGKRRISRIVCELENHVLEGAETEQEQGHSREEALHRAILRCGPPDVIAEGFAEVDHMARCRRIRYLLLSGLILCVALVVFTFWRYPAIAPSRNATLAYISLIICIMALYAWLALPMVRMARGANLSDRLALQKGTLAGIASAGLSTGISLPAALFLAWFWGKGGFGLSSSLAVQVDHTVSAATFGMPLLTWLAITGVAGATATAQTRQVATGMQIGIWSGLMYILLGTIVGSITGNALADVLAQTTWLHDSTCSGSHALAACEMGDNLGGMANFLLIFPLLGIGAGSLGGFIGSQSISTLPHSTPATAEDGYPFPIWRVLTFAVVVVGVFCAGIAGRLW